MSGISSTNIVAPAINMPVQITQAVMATRIIVTDTKGMDRQILPGQVYPAFDMQNKAWASVLRIERTLALMVCEDNATGLIRARGGIANPDAHEALANPSFKKTLWRERNTPRLGDGPFVTQSTPHVSKWDAAYSDDELVREWVSMPIPRELPTGVHIMPCLGVMSPVATPDKSFAMKLAGGGAVGMVGNFLPVMPLPVGGPRSWWSGLGTAAMSRSLSTHLDNLVKTPPDRFLWIGWVGFGQKDKWDGMGLDDPTSFPGTLPPLRATQTNGLPTPEWEDWFSYEANNATTQSAQFPDFMAGCASVCEVEDAMAASSLWSADDQVVSAFLGGDPLLY